MLTKFPADCLCLRGRFNCNDPWLFSGHKYDAHDCRADFLGGQMIGMTATCLHVPDAAGSVRAERREHEEGILIIVKFMS
jgi:hypothetical protein